MQTISNKYKVYIQLSIILAAGFLYVLNNNYFNSVFFQQITSGLIQPFISFFEPSRRIFWGFLISSGLLILLTLKIQNKPLKWRYLRKLFFSKSYWINPSSQTDIFYLFLNSFIRMSILIPLVGGQLLGALWIAKNLQLYFGNAPTLNLSWWLIATVFTLTFFIAEDFSRFLLHRCMHKIPLLWQLHKTHHSATTLSPLTLFRIHPIEMCLYFFRSLIIFSLISGVFIYLFRGQLSGFDILGVDALGFIFNAIGANLRHSHIQLSFGKFEKWFISPAQHQIHHSSDITHKDKNFGTCLALWDRAFNSQFLFSSLYKNQQKTSGKKLKFGL